MDKSGIWDVSPKNFFGLRILCIFKLQQTQSDLNGMNFQPACLINLFLAFFALFLYILGSYKFYKGQPKYLLYFGLAISIDVATAVLASFKITPTYQLAGDLAVPWYSVLFHVHIVLSTIGILGFMLLFIYLLIRQSKPIAKRLRIGQFKVLLPIWVIGEGIALSNSLSKLIFQTRLFDLF
jgi:hypothetical protein